MASNEISSGPLSVLETGLVWVMFCNRRPPRFGLEKFSVVAGSDCTLVKGNPIDGLPSTGDDIGDSSPSVLSSRRDPALLENGTRSPFLKLPLRYVVLVDLLSPIPGAFGNIGISSSTDTSPPPTFLAPGSRVNFCIAIEGSLTRASNSFKSEIFSSGTCGAAWDFFLSN